VSSFRFLKKNFLKEINIFDQFNMSSPNSDNKDIYKVTKFLINAVFLSLKESWKKKNHIMSIKQH